MCQNIRGAVHINSILPLAFFNVCKSKRDFRPCHLLVYLYIVQSEDIRLIKDEIDKGSRDLERLTRLREWCAKLDWVSNNVKENMSPPNLTRYFFL